MRSWFLRLLEILVVGKGLVLFGKGLVVFITSSNCQRVGSVHYQFKLPLEVFIWEGI